MTLASRCEDCAQPAACGLGTVALCQWCKWAAQVDILSRHPEWNAPQIGQGAPKREEPGRAPLLECDQCGATWHGTPFMDCPWCEKKPVYQQEIQASIDHSRIVDYLDDIREGSVYALAAAISLIRVGLGRETINRNDVRAVLYAATEGGFDLKSVVETMAA